MKAIVKFIFLFAVMAIGLNANAQLTEEISLNVSSDGSTKDDALKNALRTAIEQAYGAFVSANTTILNDDLVKDEIVTISTGAIKNYAIVAEYEKKDGNGYGVTVNATVSLPHLVTYAQNHGSECEFAGNTFGMQMKLWELQKKNELTALDNLFYQIEAILPSQIYWELKVEEPKILHKLDYPDWCIKKFKNPDNENLLNNLKPDDFYQVDFKLIGHLHPCHTQEEIQKQYPLSHCGRDCSHVPTLLTNLLNDGLKGIAMTNEDIKAAKDRNEELGEIYIRGSDNYKLKFRNNQDVILDWQFKLSRMFRKEIFEGICIEDNNGIVSDPHLFDIINYYANPGWEVYDNNHIPSGVPYSSKQLYSCYLGEVDGIKKLSLLVDGKYVEGKNNLAIGSDGHAFIPGSMGLFKYPFSIDFTGAGSYKNIRGILYPLDVPELTSGVFYSYDTDNNQWKVDRYSYCGMPITFKVLIPKDEIGKYSSFKIVKR